MAAKVVKPTIAPETVATVATNETPQPVAAVVPVPITSDTLDAIQSAAVAAVSTALSKALASKAGPAANLIVPALVATVVEPIVGTLMTIVRHIGMEVPNQLGNLVEKLESGIGFDLNGDGYVGDPEREPSNAQDEK